MAATQNRLTDIRFDETTLPRMSAEAEHDRKVAVYDLIEDNEFLLVGHDGGPYVLHLRLQDKRLVFDVRDGSDAPLRLVALSLTPFRSLIRDYFTICDSYYEAIKTASRARIEAIDMGRRGVHDEGAALLRERLARRIAVDQQTARRLFTLVCVLHSRG